MLYNKLENTYLIDEEDAILLYGQQEYNRLTKSGDIIYITKASLKSYSKSSTPIPQGKRITNNKRVICVETGRIFNSVTEINKEFGYNTGNICACCKGKLKSANGYHWRYA